MAWRKRDTEGRGPDRPSCQRLVRWVSTRAERDVLVTLVRSLNGHIQMYIKNGPHRRVAL